MIPRSVQQLGQQVTQPLLNGKPNGSPTVASIVVNKEVLESVISTAGKIPKPLVPNEFRYTKYSIVEGVRDITLLSGANAVFRVTGRENGTQILTSSDYPFDSSVENKALENLNEKVRGTLDLSISTFEWRQTARMLSVLTPRGLAEMEVKLFKEFSLRKDWRQLSQIPADLWLQYQYGFKPLMSDIWGAADEAIRVARKGLNSFEASSSLPLRGSIQIAGGDYSNRVLEIKSGKQVVKYGIVLDADLSEKNRMARFTSLNPVSIAWEVLPYSFVVDWFIDIGSTLRSFESALLNNVSFKSGYKTQLVAFDAKIRNIYPASKGGFRIVVNSQADGSYHYARLRRTLVSSYPKPSLPKFKANLGSSQLLSAAALLAQFFENPKASLSFNRLKRKDQSPLNRGGSRRRNAQSRALLNQ